jgi:aryl-alcohol dehydrogenase-like predicted oxidoreductase
MKTVQLGRSGLKVSRICLGMMTYGSPAWRPWVLDEAAARPIVRRAAELGVTFYDTADMYSAGESEVVTGRLLKEIYPDRDDYVVATKVFFDVGQGGQGRPRPNRSGLSRKHVMSAIDASLKRLQLDHVDLYQIHRWDPHTPIEETMEALHDVVKAGKARYIGASSMFAWQFLKAQQVARERGATQFVSMQNHYNLLYREEEREMIPLCRELGVGLIPWSPLARGFLAGNRRRDLAAGTGLAANAGATVRARTDDFAQKMYYQDSDFDVVAALSQLAQARGESNARLAYAWLMHKGVAAPIIGASRPEQLDDAVAAVSTSLSAEEMKALEAPYAPHPVLGHG